LRSTPQPARKSLATPSLGTPHDLVRVRLRVRLRVWLRIRVRVRVRLRVRLRLRLRLRPRQGRWGQRARASAR
jgi:hypothetical protein